MNAALIDFRQRYALGVDTRVIPAAAWVPLTEVQALVDQANDAMQNLSAELAAERERARQAGLDEGRSTALDQFAAAIVALRDARDQLAEKMRAQISELAVGVVERIAPSIGADRLLPVLVGEAVRQLAFEPNLVVRVHPDVAEATRQRLAAEGLGGGMAAATEIVAAPELGEFDCVIETEGGVVRAGLKEQLEQVRVILATAQRESAHDGVTSAENFGAVAE
jgi:flagellar biosynthesis/type III secretory pathway protein FliH